MKVGAALASAVVAVLGGLAVYELTRSLASRIRPGDHVFVPTLLVTGGKIVAPAASRFVVEVATGSTGRLLAVSNNLTDLPEVNAVLSASFQEFIQKGIPVTFDPNDVTRVERAPDFHPLRGST